MFYTEEDILPVVEVVENRLGKAGTMCHGSNVLMNITLSTPEFGTVWYGDFEGTLSNLKAIVTELSNNTGYSIQFAVAT